MSEEKMKTEEKASDCSRSVAETSSYSSAASSPGGTESARATFASPGDAGVSGFVGCPEDPDVSSHEIYCGCSQCAPSPQEDSCSGCGETCDSDFCFCPDGCGQCAMVTESKELGIEQFVFTCVPGAIPPGDYQDCWHPDTLMAFWDDGTLIVADTLSDKRWEVISWEAQRRPASRQYYSWFCAPLNGATDPCDEDFMRSISS